MSFDHLTYPRPSEDKIYVTKEPVEGATCPSCGGSDIRRYPIGWYCGPRIAVKCQDCYTPLSIERPGPDDAWPPFRSLARDWAVSPAERPSYAAAARAEVAR